MCGICCDGLSQSIIPKLRLGFVLLVQQVPFFEFVDGFSELSKFLIGARDTIVTFIIFGHQLNRLLVLRQRQISFVERAIGVTQMLLQAGVRCEGVSRDLVFLERSLRFAAVYETEAARPMRVGTCLPSG